MGTLNLNYQIINHINLIKNKYSTNKMVWEKAFKFFDADGSGSIEYNELEAKLKSMNVSAARLANLPKLFKEVDVDGSGSIDMGEFETMIVKRVGQIFNKIDADGSGNISPDELRAHCKNEKVEAFIKAADKDGDGEISLEEFSAAIAANAKQFFDVLVTIEL